MPKAETLIGRKIVGFKTYDNEQTGERYFMSFILDDGSHLVGLPVMTHTPSGGNMSEEVYL